MKATKKTTKQQMIINSFLEQEDAKFIEAGHAKIVTYIISEKQQFCYILFHKGCVKPLQHHAFDSVEERKKYLDAVITKQIADKEREDAELKARRDKAIEKYVVGAVLYSSWGYEQTNIDFYQILEVKGITLTLQPIRQNRTYSRDDSGKCTAIKDDFFGDKFKARINKWGRVKITEYSNASIYDGSELYWSNYY